MLHGLPGIYTPKDGDPVPVVAIPGRDAQDATPNRAIRVGKIVEDWLIPTASTINGVLVTAPVPQVGDKLTVFYRDRQTVWELRTEGQQRSWEWSDRHKRLRRLHMADISEEVTERA